MSLLTRSRFKIQAVGKLFVTVTADPDEVENVEPYVDLNFGGVYFFLYPGIVSLRDQTGQLIDPQRNAFFAGARLDDLEQFILAAKECAANQPEHWDQRVGTSLPDGKPVHQLTSRTDVLLFLERIESAIAIARQTDQGLFFRGD